MKPIVSVLMPVYNGLPYIEETIASVLAQTFQDWELVIGNNASTDVTVQVVEKFKDPRIKLINHPENIGLTKNWDYLVQMDRAPYACILGADDVFAPNHLARRVALLEKHPDAPYVHGAVRFIDPSGNDLPPDDFRCAPVEDRNVTLPRFLKVNFVNITSMVFRIAALRRHHLGFETRYSFMPDWPLQLKLAVLEGPLIYDDQPTAAYRIHAKSAARTTIKTFGWAYDAVRLRVDALMEHPAVWRQVGIDPEVEARQLTQLFCRLALQQVRRGNFANARKAWRFFREFHSRGEAVVDLPRYIAGGFKKTVCAW